MTDFPQTFADGALHADLADGVAVITLSRPQARNAMSKAMWIAVPKVMEALANDDRVQAVLLTGAGGNFCAGADISEFHSTYADAVAAREYNDLVEAGRLALTNQPKPTIAVTPGYTVGAGCGLAMACDLRFTDENTKFGMPPARLGAAYPFPGVRQMVGLIGPARAKDMLYSGRLVGAEEALRIGLADRVFPAESLMEEALSYLSGVTTLSSNSHRIAKQVVGTILDGIDSETDDLRTLFDSAYVSDDFREGYRAFLEKRKPVFK